MNDFKANFLGGFQLMAGDRQIDDFPTKKSTQLLGYLILHPDRSHSRELLAAIGTVDRRWPGPGDGAGRRLQIAYRDARGTTRLSARAGTGGIRQRGNARDRRHFAPLQEVSARSCLI